MDEDVMGNGRSRYAGDFPSNVSATWRVERRMNDNVLGPRAGGNTRGPAMPHRRGVEKQKGG